MRKAAKSRQTPAYPDQALLDLCGRTAKLEAKINPAYELPGAPDELNPEDEEAIYALEEELSPIHEKILAIRPATLKGLIAKAKRAAWARMDFDPGVRAHRAEHGGFDDIFSGAVIDDLVAMVT